MAVRNNHVHARQSRHFRGRQLASHPAATAVIARTSSEASNLVCYLVHVRYQLRVGVPMRVRGVQTIHLAQQHQHVGIQHIRQYRRQPIIVTVGHSDDLLNRYDIVLVHDRHDPRLQQHLHRATHV